MIIQGGEIEFLIDQIVQRKGKAAGDDLLTEHHGQQQAVILSGFVAGHGCDLLARDIAIVMPEVLYNLNVEVTGDQRSSAANRRDADGHPG